MTSGVIGALKRTRACVNQDLRVWLRLKGWRCAARRLYSSPPTARWTRSEMDTLTASN
jgi:hypothetical protein